MTVATFGRLMNISLRVEELQRRGDLTCENFRAALIDYLDNNPSPDGLEGFLMLGKEEWYADLVPAGHRITLA